MESNVLTPQEKTKVFLLYAGAMVVDEDGEEGFLIGASSEGIELDSNPFAFPVEECTLLLTPLPLISKRDALDLARINSRLYIDKGIKHWRVSADETRIEYASGTQFNHYIQYYKFRSNEADFLRSKCYDTPIYFGPDHWANGKTAIELKIAKPKI